MNKQKIIITYGPAIANKQKNDLINFFKFCHENKVDIIRLNLSHYHNIDDVKHDVQTLKDAMSTSQINIPIMFDTKGPELRVANLINDINIKKNDALKIGFNGSQLDIKINESIDFKQIQINTKVFLDDGKLQGVVIDCCKEFVTVKFNNNHLLKNYKKIIFEKTNIHLPFLSNEDNEYLLLANELKIDYVALSFVNSVNDLLQAKEVISNSKVIAKIETLQAVKNMESILCECDGLMCARGDLSLNVGFEMVPIVQHELVNVCKTKQKLSIVATELLSSCVNNIYPARSDISDISLAIRQQYDYLMLSNETSVAIYPENNITILSQLIDVISTYKFK